MNTNSLVVVRFFDNISYYQRRWAEIHQRNVADGVPQLNTSAFLSSAFEEEAREIERLTERMFSSFFHPDYIDQWVRAYKVPCLLYRQRHADMWSALDRERG